MRTPKADLQQKQSDGGGFAVRAEDAEEQGDEGGVAGSEEGAGAGVAAEGRGETVAGEQCVGEGAKLGGLWVEPLAGVVAQRARAQRPVGGQWRW